MVADQETMDLILNAVPQKHPFRFIDEIIELDDDHIVGSYRYREDEYFYEGHFPDRPITPGVILIETMAQTGVVAFGLYLTMRQKDYSLEETKQLTTLFTFVEGVEFNNIVSPGERVIVRGEKIYFRRGSLKTRVSMERENGENICFGVLAGAGVMLNEA
ncbi:3-hydroxyacyl-ACP dehydratase FabZ family protein [Syntrophus aciditrophicus]|jgi:3-hydroxyacyl-[acyl-carrier-protein] dehydratase|uniref:3-hydroxymyristoyl/3-hydroxydecanoyl-(Acyl carrier protein) dehydratase n=1 Tax=Syntrophus aciditrophicus (strain SB) TaxID=56780 RepID=Q2LXQ3_SYNAS|nr:hydroxymyristoyl-ACP dehydratase [Syntrophus aciditrophicus]ABC78867.1 3-hydroxymyristoyl/3-hydroxydecanoyl-(acyl carrier protein) dehydratase [Syntrophus aciditrophicus SB]OPY19303.1 MAG: 3-hydroxyacyl-(acyl-carrier-protein) dehydratase FabZ [Syntrophus sp. PtaB.Bin075]